MQHKLEILQSKDAEVRRLIRGCNQSSEQIRRKILLTDWKIRTYAPAWLELAGFCRHADQLRELPEINGPAETRALVTTINTALTQMEAASNGVLAGFPSVPTEVRLKRLDLAAGFLADLFLAGVFPGYSRLAWSDPTLAVGIRGGFMRYVRALYMGAGVLIALRIISNLPAGVIADEAKDVESPAH